jgi:hypothetical protein
MLLTSPNYVSFFKKIKGCKAERLRKCWVTTTLGEELLLKSQDECDGNTFQRLQHKTTVILTPLKIIHVNLSFMVTNFLYTFSNKRVTTMTNKTNKCTYKYVNLLYYKHVGGYAIYATINLHICICICWFCFS